MREKSYFQRESTAKSLLQLFFGKTDVKEVSVDYIFQVAGRDLRKEKLNRAWLGNCIYVLKMYGLAERVLSKSGRRRVIGVKLTAKGLQELGRDQPDTKTHEDRLTDSMTVNDLIDDIKKRTELLQQMLPTLDVSFNVGLKDERKEVGQPVN